MPSDDEGRSSSQASERCGETSPTTTLDGSQVSEPSMQTSLKLTGSKASSNPMDKIDNEVLVVDWDGPDDPQNPKNWSFKRKWAATAIVSGFAFLTPISSSMVAPATSQLAVEFGVHDSAVVALFTSIFLLAFAIGPLFLGPMSEIYGRSRILQLANLWFLAWNVGCGFAQNEKQLLVFRFLSGLGGSAPVSRSVVKHSLFIP